MRASSSAADAERRGPLGHRAGHAASLPHAGLAPRSRAADYDAAGSRLRADPDLGASCSRSHARLASVNVYGRLVGLFDALALDDDNEGRRVVSGPLSQQRIAERVGASKAMVNRLLHDLARDGYIEVSPERIVLLKQLPRAGSSQHLRR